MAITKQIIFF